MSVVSSTSSIGMSRPNFIKGGTNKLERVHEDSDDDLLYRAFNLAKRKPKRGK
jgi:hypothetical protein